MGNRLIRIRLRLWLGEVTLRYQLGEQAAGVLQLAERAAFDDAALVEDEDQVGVGYGREAVGNDERRTFPA